MMLIKRKYASRTRFSVVYTHVYYVNVCKKSNIRRSALTKIFFTNQKFRNEIFSLIKTVARKLFRVGLFYNSLKFAYFV